MKTLSTLTQVTICSTGIFIALCLGGCGDCEGCGTASTTTSEATATEGRAETQKLEAAAAVGYDAEGLRKSVDKMLDKRDQQNAELENAQNIQGANSDQDQ